MEYDYNFEVSALVGKTIKKIVVERDQDMIHFYIVGGEHFVMMHMQDCCESVTINDINGDVLDFEGQIILEAYECTNENNTDEGSETWTFYNIRCMKGYLNIRWYGESNGYYSESVNFLKVIK